ncbi:hypothetical protein TWF718_009786 [Orbilia javanica]|uniref:Clr5 domain-containing protein n=1 Tax=Orbilia javanica TaxID=47235 RepID=A0AAN8RF99_9PEZI
MSKFSNFKSYDGAKVRKRAYRKNEVWDEHKDFILDLLQRGEKQKSILDALKNERGFNTNLNQLKSKLGIWGVSNKNLAKKQRRWIYLMNQRRQEMGKETMFYFGDTGQAVTETQLGSIMKEGEKEYSGGIPASPGELEMSTPPPMTPGDEDPGSDPISEQSTDPRPQNANVGITERIDTLNPKAVEPIVTPIGSATLIPDSPASSQVSIEDVDPEIPSDTSDKSQPPEPSSMENEENTEIPSAFENIYLNVLKSLDSFHLAANSSAAATENQNIISPVSNPGYKNTGAIPPPEYSADLTEWMEVVYKDADLFVNMVHQTVEKYDLPFPVCRDTVTLQWVEDYDEEPLPYHISLAILNGVPLTPVIPGWEDLPVAVRGPDSRWLYSTSTDVIQCTSWLPIKDPPERILMEEEWERIDFLFSKYYNKLKKFADKLAKSEPDTDFILIFRQRAAHLQKLRHSFGEFSYYTTLALEGFAELCFQVHSIPNSESLFLYDCVAKIFKTFGLIYHECALDFHKNLGYLRRNLHDFSGSLECHVMAYYLGYHRWGFESMECIDSIPDIARCLFKLGLPDDADYVIRIGLKNIQSVASKTPPDEYYIHYQLGKALKCIAEVCKLGGRNDAAATVSRFCIHQFMIYRSKYTGTDISNNGWVPQHMGDAFLILKDYENAARMFQYAFNEYSGYYGEVDRRTMEAIRKLCKSMTRRGLAIYTVPILEKTLMLKSEKGDQQEEDEVKFEIWMQYTEAVMRVSGRHSELANLRKRLTEG